MSVKELMILRLLIDNPRGLYGSNFVELSNGVLGRGTIYTMLDRLIAKGYLREAKETPEEPGLTPRTRHIISAAGHRAYREFLNVHGLSTNKRFTLGTALRPIFIFITLAATSLRAQAAVTFDIGDMTLDVLSGIIAAATLSAIVAAVAAFLRSRSRPPNVYDRVIEEVLREISKREKRSPCGRLPSLCDWIPGPIARARVLKMVADQERHIKKLRKQKRKWAARWIIFSTYVLAIRLIGVTGCLAIVEYIVRRRSE